MDSGDFLIPMRPAPDIYDDVTPAEVAEDLARLADAAREVREAFSELSDETKRQIGPELQQGILQIEDNLREMDSHLGDRRRDVTQPIWDELEATRQLIGLNEAARMVGFAIAGLTLNVPDANLQQFIDEAVRRALAEMRTGIGAARESEYLTVEEAAAFLRCTPDRIRKLRSRGVLTRYGDGGRALIKREELEAWIQNEPRRGRR